MHGGGLLVVPNQSIFVPMFTLFNTNKHSIDNLHYLINQKVTFNLCMKSFDEKAIFLDPESVFYSLIESP